MDKFLGKTVMVTLSYPYNNSSDDGGTFSFIDSENWRFVFSDIESIGSMPNMSAINNNYSII